jgi:hypothetical protein
MSKARKIAIKTINELLTTTNLKTRVKLSCWFMINNVIHETGVREEKAWDNNNKRDVELMMLLENKTMELTETILRNIKEWEEDGKPI